MLHGNCQLFPAPGVGAGLAGALQVGSEGQQWGQRSPGLGGYGSGVKSTGGGGLHAVTELCVGLGGPFSGKALQIKLDRGCTRG